MFCTDKLEEEDYKTIIQKFVEIGLHSMSVRSADAETEKIKA